MMVTEAGAGRERPIIDQAEETKLVLLDEEALALPALEESSQALRSVIRERLGYPEDEHPNEADIVDTRVEKHTLVRPDALAIALPLTARSAQTTRDARQVGADILARKDDRVMFLTGPCSISDPEAAIEFAERHVLRWRAKYADDLEVGMRYYDEKPRTGPKKGKQESWKGFAYDPRLDRSDDINLGLVASRLIVSRITDATVWVAKERLSALTPQYQNGLIAHDVIGARTTPEPKAREYGAATSSLLAFKNTLEGSIEAAAAAAAGAGHPHSFVGMETDGRVSHVAAKGNRGAYIILRGSNGGPNYSPEHIEEAKRLAGEYGIIEAIGIDFSHGNSGKKAENQIVAAQATSRQIATGELAIRSVWTESNLVAGRQDSEPGKEPVYGQSITDECIDPEETEEILDMVAAAVRQRRKVGKDLAPAQSAS